MVVQLTRKRFSVDDYDRMGTVGILSPGDRVELINGEVIEMSPIGSRHAACVDRLNRQFNRLVGNKFIVRVQNPIQLDLFNEPQPDVCLVADRSNFYADAHPVASDIILIIEVADSSVEKDREMKRSLYAVARIPEYWIVNLEDQCIEVYSQPDGVAYQLNRQFVGGETIKAETVPELELQVEQILGE